MTHHDEILIYENFRNMQIYIFGVVFLSYRQNYHRLILHYIYRLTI